MKILNQPDINNYITLLCICSLIVFIISCALGNDRNGIKNTDSENQSFNTNILLGLPFPESEGFYNTNGEMIIEKKYEDYLILQEEQLILGKLPFDIDLGYAIEIIKFDGSIINTISADDNLHRTLTNSVTEKNKIDFNEGLAVFSWGGKGYFDKNFNIVIEPIFKEASGFENGSAIVVDDNKNLNIIDKKGNITKKTDNKIHYYIYTKDFPILSGEFLPVKDSNTNLFGYVDRNLDLIMDFKYLDALPFSCGLAGVEIKSDKRSSAKKLSFIDKNSDVLISDVFTGTPYFLNDCLSLMSVERKYSEMVINKKMDTICEVPSGGRLKIFEKPNLIFGSPRWDSMEAFLLNSDGDTILNKIDFEIVEYRKEVGIIKKLDKYGLISSNGQILIEPVFQNLRFETSDILAFEKITYTKDELSAAKSKELPQGVKSLYFSIQYDWISDIGYINKEGQLIISKFKAKYPYAIEHFKRDFASCSFY